MGYKKTLNEDLGRKSIADFKHAPKQNISIILDDLRSMQNVGNIFRSADAFLIEKIYLCGITPRPPHRDIHKSALGATETVAWAYEKEIITTLQNLRKDNFILLAIEQTSKSTMLETYDFDATKKYAFIFGNEMNGVQEKVLEHIDGCIELPQFGTKHSINVAVCAGICLWEYTKQMKTECC